MSTLDLQIGTMIVARKAFKERGKIIFGLCVVIGFEEIMIEKCKQRFMIIFNHDRVTSYYIDGAFSPQKIYDQVFDSEFELIST